MSAHPLVNTWVFAVEAHGDWGNSIDFAEVSSVGAFWNVYETHFPSPSLAFRVSDDTQRATFVDPRVKNLRSMSIHRKGIALTWENKRNVGMHTVALPNATASTVDQLWETSLLLAIGGSCEGVHGVRLLDRGKRGSVDLRLEVWSGKERPPAVVDAWGPCTAGKRMVWNSFHEHEQ
jgi:hypothetical protein